MTTKADLALAQRLADAAGEAIRPFYRARFAIETKGDLSPVTQADRAAEAAMRAILEKERPNDGIVGEEYGVVRENAGRIWVLDPIDGTRSFIAGRPIFGTLRSEEHTSELQSLKRISNAVFCMKKKNIIHKTHAKLRQH